MFDLELLHLPLENSALRAMWLINQANIPEVGDIPTIEEFKSLTEMSSYVIVVNKGKETAGFIILMREKEEYHSLNYKFFKANYDEFLYVDRVAIKDGFRRQGLGKMIYEEVFRLATEINTDVCCEVNTLPRNDASLAFHAEFGFQEVGIKDYDDHSVVYLKSPVNLN
ncbi:GNAT family N-acetyltransferase [Gammaproteobacteria bacterium]|nr:GNAT family N-acetyltransferase [Gammaproteobacteria bacterium]